MIEILWRRHYQHGITGSYHGDMARAFALMLADPDCDGNARRKLHGAIRIHCTAERWPEHEGRKWFCERCGSESEQLVFKSTLQESETCV